MKSVKKKKSGRLLGLSLVVVAVVTTIGLMPCSGRSDTSSDAPKTYKTRTGKTIIVSENHPVGRSLSTIEITTRGFDHNFQGVYEDRDPISDVFVVDLDGNNFDEIYIITKSAGSGSYGNLLGLASNKDKSLSMIHFPEGREGDAHFQGYMGHDTFKIEGQRLVRIFPIYNKGDTNGNPSGGWRKLVYGLVPGEAMWQLRVEHSEKHDVLDNEPRLIDEGAKP